MRRWIEGAQRPPAIVIDRLAALARALDEGAQTDQFEVRAVRTRRGITMVGLFSATITRAEREAAAPYREAMAAKRLA